MKTFFEIRKQKYLEALDRNDKMKAVDVLVKDLKVFSKFNEDLFKELTHLLTLENFRENEQLSKYGDTRAARNIMFLEIKKLIESNPVFRDKLVFPSMKSSRLRTLINHSMNWQHQTCKNPKPNPEVKTLFIDHNCSFSNGARAPTPVNLPGAAVKVLVGEWDEIEKYISGFIKIDDNKFSMKTFFEIRKQKYLEALDRNDKMKAVDVLVKDLKVFSKFNEDLFKELTHLLTLENFRENEQLSKYGDTRAARNIMFLEIKKLIESNPVFRDKLVFPSMKSSRLRTLINHSMNWQHQTCKNPKPNPEVKTLFIDHNCSFSNGARAPTPVNLPGAAV
ncbi:hypothetical protein RYX36_031861, partial [Vicia faba]